MEHIQKKKKKKNIQKLKEKMDQLKKIKLNQFKMKLQNYAKNIKNKKKLQLILIIILEYIIIIQGIIQINLIIIYLLAMIKY